MIIKQFTRKANGIASNTIDTNADTRYNNNEGSVLNERGEI
ncbi:hypothetical protein [uncultured Veillonella sp.]|nr:hypothetical protein [uncultured Veillonella sp.]